MIPEPAGDAPDERRYTLADALALAVGWQRAGALDAADGVYRQILAAVPGQPDALHFLGLLEFQRGHADAALALLERAVAAAPAHADLRSNFGNVLQALGRLDAAEREYRAALAANPALVAAWNNLGVVLMEKGETAEASRVFQTAFALDSGQSDEIRKNLRLALAKLDNPAYDAPEESKFSLVRRGQGEYLLLTDL